MQAVILAAGKSTRTYPLTITRPKPLLPLLDTTVLEHNLKQLQGLVTEAIIVVGYQKDQIIEKVGESYANISITYIEQSEQKGTAHALQVAQDKLTDRFLVLNGDDVYFQPDIQACLQHRNCILVAEHQDWGRFGIIQTRGDLVEDIIEKPQNKTANLVNTGLYIFDKSIFDFELKLSSRGELEITDYVRMLDDIKWHRAQNPWIPISYPWNLIEANASLLRDMESNILGRLEENVHIEGVLHLGRGSVIKSGTYIEGPVYIGENCIVGPSAYLRPETVILDNTWIGFGVEIVDSILMQDIFCKHRSYIGHSVIGPKTNIGAGFITADWRHDMQNHTTLIKDLKINTYRDKLGAFLGEGVMTGIHTSIYPGRKIWPGLTTLPGSVVTHDIMN